MPTHASRFRLVPRAPFVLAAAAILVVGASCRSDPPPPPPPPPPPAHTWPDASYRPYALTSAFNWEIQANPRFVLNTNDIVNQLVGAALSGCDPNGPRQSSCKPGDLVAHTDGQSGGGWPTYWSLPTDPEIAVNCSGGPCPYQNLTLRMPVGARIQVGSPDRHLTVMDVKGDTGLKKPNYEYDFYQVTEDVIPASGSIHVTSQGATSLDGLGQTEAGGNTNAAGFGNIAGRIRIEELRAGQINHALAIAVPCTRKVSTYPANHTGVPGYCNSLGPDTNWPAMGQLLWLDLDKGQLESNLTSRGAPGWAKVIMSAMHEHGAYVNDNGGYLNSFFQIQTEAQSQYTSLGAGDPWLDFAKQNWVPGANQDYVGRLQGTPTNPASSFYADWRTFWQQHLHVLDSCQLPGQACIG